MEKNKYYTPELSEFHVGFEFEETPFIGGYKLISNPIWHKVIYQITEKAPLSTIESMIQFNHARVKYLNKEDIESLCNEFNYKFINTYKGPQGIERYDIVDSNGTILMEYITRCMTNFSIGNINITIRNKSELKVLFQQIKI